MSGIAMRWPPLLCSMFRFHILYMYAVFHPDIVSRGGRGQTRVLKMLRGVASRGGATRNEAHAQKLHSKRGLIHTRSRRYIYAHSPRTSKRER